MITKAFLSVWICFCMLQSGINSMVLKTNLGGDLYLVNRTYRLTEHYQPEDLIVPNVRRRSSSITLRPQAAKALEELFSAAHEEGYRLIAVSGFRSYETQRLIYQRKIKAVGSVEKAQLLVAPPGASEHQLGLAIDIGRVSSSNLNASFGKSKEGQWVKQNAHRFGFILRYREEWTDITGYANEPWHLRYVGKDHAEVLYRMNIPLELYIQRLLLFHQDGASLFNVSK